jgi:hypothetical protein
MRALWTGRMVEHRWKIFDFGAMQVSPVPAKPVPIYVGGVSDAGREREPFTPSFRSRPGSISTCCDGWSRSAASPKP